MRTSTYEISQTSENTLVVKFLYPGEIDVSLCRQMDHCRQHIMLTNNHRGAILDCVCAYASLLVYFDILKTTGSELIEDISTQLTDVMSRVQDLDKNTRIIEIPTCYSEKTGPDLARLANDKGLSVSELIDRHCNQTYTVFAIGFLPGFAYLGFVDEALATPRLATPRQQVASGSVGIADRQTGIYPRKSAGGWNIIGQTRRPLLHSDNGQTMRCIFNVGDQVRFVPEAESTFFLTAQASR